MKRRESDPPACVDCVHRYRGDDGVQCYHDACSTFDPVNGRQPVLATIARVSGACGMSGSLFEVRRGPNWLERNGLWVLVFGIFAVAIWWNKGLDALQALIKMIWP